MEKKKLWPTILRLARSVGMIVGCIVVLAGLSCLALAAWRTFYHLGNRMMLLGGAVLLMGVAFPTVNTQAVGMDFGHLMSTGSSTKRQPVYSMTTFHSTMTMLIGGGVAVLLGHLIRRASLAALGLQ